MLETKTKPKVETVEEFVARGGIIQKIPPQIYESDEVVKSTIAKTPQIHTLDDGAHYYAERRVRKRKDPKPLDLTGIDISKLPQDLVKFLKLDEKAE